MPDEQGDASTSTRAGRARRPTMRDVAARAGVSQQLVSLIFRNAPGPNPDTRERVLQAAQELGYHRDSAASVLRRTRSRQLGVVTNIGHPFGEELVENVYVAAERLGYQIVLGALTATRDERYVAQELLGYRSEALIMLGGGTDNELLTELAPRVPVVTVGRRVRNPSVDSVRTDDARGVREVVDHLVSLGHHEIVHVDGGDKPGAADRRRGYRSAMRRHQLEDRIRVLPGDYTEESGAQAAQQLVESERLPTAVVAGNDECAFGLLDFFVRAQIRVPDDISVVGYDDSRLARFPFLNLTTVRQDPARMAQFAVEAAVERLDNGRARARDIILTPTLVVRQTTSTPHSP